MSKETKKSSTTLERILLAAIHCYDLYGVKETTLEQVAEQASVGRSTVYRHAKNRAHLLSKVLLRDADHALAELDIAMRNYHGLEEVVIESILFLMSRRNNYQMQHILYGSAENTNPGNGLSMEMISGLAASTLKSHFEQAIAESAVPPNLTLAMLADWVGRITLSLHSQASEFTATEDALRVYLKVVLAPIFHPQLH